MIYKKGICSECDKERLIVKPLKKLCNICNRKRLDSGKEIKPLKRKFPKPTGEKPLFLAIWAIRPRLCTNCGDGLGDEPKTFYFAHIKGKGANPELRLEPSNIRLLCFECHRIYDQGTEEQFKKRAK
jgi:5-methylcytosine-specific restriction endonuclease McrA